MQIAIPKELWNNLKAELSELDKEQIDVLGKKMKPSQCYYFSTNPPHILFNTNCPDSLKENITSILRKYQKEDENSSQE